MEYRQPKGNAPDTVRRDSFIPSSGHAAPTQEQASEQIDKKLDLIIDLLTKGKEE